VKQKAIEVELVLTHHYNENKDWIPLKGWGDFNRALEKSMADKSGTSKVPGLVDYRKGTYTLFESNCKYALKARKRNESWRGVAIPREMLPGDNDNHVGEDAIQQREKCLRLAGVDPGEYDLYPAVHFPNYVFFGHK